jgi:hypothetical protein
MPSHAKLFVALALYADILPTYLELSPLTVILELAAALYRCMPLYPDIPPAYEEE